ncbi:MAG: hypothetical protein JO090_02510, partial [Rhizobacter sp.]|nr:hypothetical protein [Rhizobacter sp.]
MTVALVGRALRRARFPLVALLVAALASGCSSLSSWNPFAPDRPKPKDLEPIAA